MKKEHTLLPEGRILDEHGIYVECCHTKIGDTPIEATIYVCSHTGKEFCHFSQEDMSKAIMYAKDKIRQIRSGKSKKDSNRGNNRIKQYKDLM